MRGWWVTGVRFRPSGFALIVGVLFTAVGVTSGGAKDGKEELYGRWRLVDIVSTDPVVGMSNSESNGFVGKVLTVSPRRITFPGGGCAADFSIEVESAEELKFERMDFKALHLREPVTNFSTTCGEFYLRTDGEILFERRGFFFLAKRLATKAPPDSKPLRKE